jgi:AcrR family transcriptional regulator
MKTQDTDRPETQAEAIRADILRHATDLFSHYGFNKTNIGDIANRCCMSPGNLYRYFRNKQAIGLAAVRNHFEATEAEMDTILRTTDGTHETRVRTFIATAISHIAEETRTTPKIIELAEFLCNDEDGLKLLDEHIAWKRTRLAQEIDQGVATGEFAPCEPEATAAAILNAFKAFWMPMTLARWRDPETILPEMAAILDLIFAGLRARG